MNAKRTLSLLLLVPLICSWACAQKDDRESRIKTVDAFVHLLEQADDGIENQLQELVVSKNVKLLRPVVLKIRKLVNHRAVADIMIESKTHGKLVYETGSQPLTVEFEMTAETPIQIVQVALSRAESKETEPMEPFAWGSLEQSLDNVAEDGFEGVVLVTRDGRTAIHKAYGFANRDKKILNRTDTVFAIGSAPIDFTHAGILLLKDRGKINLHDPITKYFANVPHDKQSITIHHLMQGQSGLHNFHDVPSDENPDHTWIDRDEAVRRIFEKKLLFKPGAGSDHSHSAWGLLAAIIEIASGESYEDFSRTHLYKPAGMKDTGFFGDAVPESRIAVGYGYRDSSIPNSPPNWGKTSWLVMGSGGQISTLDDMFRWQVAMRNGDILSPESTRMYLGMGDEIHAAGDMFGFELIHTTQPGQLFMIISNSVGSDEKRQQFERLSRQLHQLVDPQRGAAKFSLGIVMDLSPDGIVLQQVVRGSAADKGGLRPGDLITSINGAPIGDEPMTLLSPSLINGASIRFGIERDGEPITIRVKPAPKNENR